MAVGMSPVLRSRAGLSPRKPRKIRQPRIRKPRVPRGRMPRYAVQQAPVSPAPMAPLPMPAAPVAPQPRAPQPAPSGPVGIVAGGGWGGSAGVARTSLRPARRLGVPVSSAKRSTVPAGSSTGSDHHTSQRTAFAYDLDTPGIDSPVGHRLARRIARRYGVSYTPNSHESGGIVRARDGRRYRIQLLYGSQVGHGDHVHVGVRRI